MQASGTPNSKYMILTQFQLAERMQASGTPNSKYMILKQTPEPEDLKANLFILWKRFYMV